MTYPLYAIGRNPAHERAISLGLAEHHDRMAESTAGDDRADHIRAAQACRDNAAKWERIARMAPRVQAPAPTKRGRK